MYLKLDPCSPSPSMPGSDPFKDFQLVFPLPISPCSCPAYLHTALPHPTLPKRRLVNECIRHSTARIPSTGKYEHLVSHVKTLSRCLLPSQRKHSILTTWATCHSPTSMQVSSLILKKLPCLLIFCSRGFPWPGCSLPLTSLKTSNSVFKTPLSAFSSVRPFLTTLVFSI